MKLPPIAISMILAAIALAPLAHAQDMVVPEAAVRSEVEAVLPDWWQIERFEITGITVNAPMTAPTGKAPALPAIESDVTGAKAGPVMPAQQTVAFSATLRLAGDIFEPLFALDGTAIVRPIMEAGLELDVSGSIGISGDGDSAEFTPVQFDQSGFMEMGRPLAAFDMPALVEGSEEADLFFASRDAARAEGRFNKIMGDTGEEL